MQAAASDDEFSVTHSPAADEATPALETFADDNPPPTTRPANTMAPAVPWSTKRVPVLATDTANIQAWLAAVRPIIAFHDASELLTIEVPRTPPGRALARQVLLFLSQTTDGSLRSCLVDNDPAASWTALLALRPDNAKAIESTAATINKIRLTDTTVRDYTRLHLATHTTLHDMDANHYHAAVLTHMHRILRGIDDIPEMSAVVLQYSKIDDPTNATVTELFAKSNSTPLLIKSPSLKPTAFVPCATVPVIILPIVAPRRCYLEQSEIPLGKPLANTGNETVYTVHSRAP
jgi:hypothetical protein